MARACDVAAMAAGGRRAASQSSSDTTSCSWSRPPIASASILYSSRTLSTQRPLCDRPIAKHSQRSHRTIEHECGDLPAISAPTFDVALSTFKRCCVPFRDQLAQFYGPVQSHPPALAAASPRPWDAPPSLLHSPSSRTQPRPKHRSSPYGTSRTRLWVMNRGRN